MASISPNAFVPRLIRKSVQAVSATGGFGSFMLDMRWQCMSRPERQRIINSEYLQRGVGFAHPLAAALSAAQPGTIASTRGI